MSRKDARSSNRVACRSSARRHWPRRPRRRWRPGSRRVSKVLRGIEVMSILIDETTQVIVQGFTGQIGTFHTKEMMEYGTNIVGGVTPGKGGTTHLGKPVFNTTKEAVDATGATASIIFVPAPFAADSIMEAADAGIHYCVAITDGIPAQDMIRVKRYMRRYRAESRMILTGPNCAGTISPGKAMMGIMPGHIYMGGPVGVIGRSGTLGYEAASQMKALGIGVSTSVGIGGDPVNGSSFRDHLALFEADDETDAVIMVGEIGGPQEAETLTAAGITMAPNPSAMGDTVARVLAEHGLTPAAV